MPIAIIPLEGPDRGERVIFAGEKKRTVRISGFDKDGGQYDQFFARGTGTQKGGILNIIKSPTTFTVDLENESVVLTNTTPKVRVVGYDKEHALDPKLFG